MKENHTLNVLKKFVLIFACLIIFYVISLTLVYAIPNSKLEPNLTVSLNQVDSEGGYPRAFFPEYYGTMLDTITDKLMFEKAVAEKANAFQSAMDNRGYFRYWHGYQLFLRPSLLVTNYYGLRYIGFFVYFIVFFFVFSQIRQKLGNLISLGFLLSMLSCFAYIVPASIQFMSIFMIMLISSSIILHKYNKDNFNKNLIYTFFIIGSVTCFMDLLTAPMLTLGVPLTLVLLLNLKTKGNDGVKKNIIDIIKYSMNWVLGYGITWATKWAIATPALKVDVFKDAKDAILFRTEGSTDYPLSHYQAFKMNILAIFNSSLTKAVILLAIVWFVFFILYKKPLNEILKAIPLLILSTFPYIWFFALSNHSQIHSWFTYRIQITSIFCILSAMIYSINWNKFNAKFFKSKNNVTAS